MPDDRSLEVVNTGPLVALARGGVLSLLGTLPARFVTPSQVAAELAAGSVVNRSQVPLELIEVRELSTPLERLGPLTLDVGEAAVIQLAIELEARTVVIDERRGRRVARALGLEVTGTLGLLLRARRLGLLAALRPVISTMRAGGVFFADELVERVAREAGE